MSMNSEPLKITSPTLHATILFTLSVFVALLIMACVLKVEVVARGQGKVVPVSRVQVVEPEFAGKIKAINVRNGDTVQKGESVIVLDDTDARAEVNTIRSEVARLHIERARITALIEGIDGLEIAKREFSDKTVDRFAATADSEHNFYPEQLSLLRAEIADLQVAMSQAAAQIESNHQSVSVTQANIERVEAGLEIHRERLEIAQDLIDRGVSNRAAFLDTQEAFTALEKEREIYLRELTQKRSQEVALAAEQRRIITSQRNQLLQRRSEIEARLATLREQLRSAERRVLGATLLAPVSGVVDQLGVFTIGAVAQSGEALMRIVPEGQEIEIEAVFSNIDIGFVRTGQQAKIGVDAYPSARFGFMNGIVSDVAADAVEVTPNTWAYTVRIAPENTMLIHGAEQHRLRIGMTSSVDIVTDKRRLISYFFAPIVDTIQSALGER